LKIGQLLSYAFLVQHYNEFNFSVRVSLIIDFT